MPDLVDYQIFGDDMQLVEIALDPGEGVRAEAGAMMCVEDHIQMQTATGGGVFKGFKRMVTGESFFITNFTYRGGGQGRAVAAPASSAGRASSCSDCRERGWPSSTRVGRSSRSG